MKSITELSKVNSKIRSVAWRKISYNIWNRVNNYLYNNNFHYEINNEINDNLNWDLISNIKHGDRIAISWKGMFEIDYGYCFGLPGLNIDEGKFMVHIPDPCNPDGMDISPEIFIHSYNLALNKRIESIKVL